MTAPRRRAAATLAAGRRVEAELARAAAVGVATPRAGGRQVGPASCSRPCWPASCPHRRSARRCDFLPGRGRASAAPCSRAGRRCAHYNPLGTRARRLVRDAARLGASAARCTRSLPAGKAYTTVELKVNIVRAVERQGAAGARRRRGDPLGQPDGHRRRPPGRARRQAVRSRLHHLLHLRRPRLTMRLLHTMLRVGDLQRSIDFYTQVMGMTLLRTTERPEQKLLARLRRLRHATPSRPRSSSPTTTASTSYELGTAYGHIAIGVPDVRGRLREDPRRRRHRHARGRPGQGRHDGDRLRHRPRRLQDRADRARRLSAAVAPVRRFSARRAPLPRARAA